MIKIIGIGNAGCRIVEQIQSDSIDVFAIDTDKESLDKISIENNLYLSSKLINGFETPEEEKFKNTRFRMNFFIHPDDVKIVADFGGQIGTLMTVELAQTLKDLEIPVECFITKPALYEGTRRHDVYWKGVQALEDADIPYTVIDLSSINQTAERMTVNDFLCLADEIIIEKLKV